MIETASVFYSWQSDSPTKSNRYFIADCVERATKKAGIACEQSLRFDSDTQGEAGTPDIPKVVLEKISSVAIFVGDVTLVGKATMSKSFLARLFRRFIKRQKSLDNRKMLPNPNVLLELGYAAHCLGWDRVILVMNSHFGPPEYLPFDLKHRRFPISYYLLPITRQIGLEIHAGRGVGYVDC
jgi:hypothetical protein